MKAIIVPPNAIEMGHTRKNNGIGEQLQSFLETMAHKHQYRLIVGITPESASAFNGRVTKILRQTGYYMGPPSDKANVYFWEHQSTYQGKGIPEIGMEWEYFVPPTIH